MQRVHPHYFLDGNSRSSIGGNTSHVDELFESSEGQIKDNSAPEILGGNERPSDGLDDTEDSETSSIKIDIELHMRDHRPRLLSFQDQAEGETSFTSSISLSLEHHKFLDCTSASLQQMVALKTDSNSKKRTIESQKSDAPRMIQSLPCDASSTPMTPLIPELQYSDLTSFRESSLSLLLQASDATESTSVPSCRSLSVVFFEDFSSSRHSEQDSQSFRSHSVRTLLDTSRDISRSNSEESQDRDFIDGEGDVAPSNRTFSMLLRSSFTGEQPECFHQSASLEDPFEKLLFSSSIEFGHISAIVEILDESSDVPEVQDDQQSKEVQAPQSPVNTNSPEPLGEASTAHSLSVPAPTAEPHRRKISFCPEPPEVVHIDSAQPETTPSTGRRRRGSTTSSVGPSRAGQPQNNLSALDYFLRIQLPNSKNYEPKQNKNLAVLLRDYRRVLNRHPRIIFHNNTFRELVPLYYDKSRERDRHNIFLHYHDAHGEGEKYIPIFPAQSLYQVTAYRQHILSHVNDPLTHRANLIPSPRLQTKMTELALISVLIPGGDNIEELYRTGYRPPKITNRHDPDTIQPLPAEFEEGRFYRMDDDDFEFKQVVCDTLMVTIPNLVLYTESADRSLFERISLYGQRMQTALKRYRTRASKNKSFAFVQNVITNFI